MVELPDCQLILWSSDSCKLFQSLEIQTEEAVKILSLMILLHIDQLAIAFKLTVPTVVKVNSTKVLCLCVLFAPWLILYAFCHIGILKNENTIRVLNSLDPDQAQQFITSTCKVTNPP